MIKLLTLLLPLGISACAASETYLRPDFARERPGAEQVRGAFFALSVTDARRVADWYRTHFGFETLSEGEVPERKIAFALLRREQSLIEINQRPDPAPAPTGADGARKAIAQQGIFKIGLNVRDLEALHDRLEKAGVTFNHHIVQPEGNSWRTFAVRDREGNIVQIFG